jgi:hypothetical protein
MKLRFARILMQLASPRVGTEFRKAIREITRIGGVRRVASSSRIPRLLSIDYNPRVTRASALVQFVRRSWAGARLV